MQNNWNFNRTRVMATGWYVCGCSLFATNCSTPPPRTRDGNNNNDNGDGKHFDRNIQLTVFPSDQIKWWRWKKKNEAFDFLYINFEFDWNSIKDALEKESNNLKFTFPSIIMTFIHLLFSLQVWKLSAINFGRSHMKWIEAPAIQRLVVSGNFGLESIHSHCSAMN